MRYLRINIDLYFNTPIGGSLRSKITKVRNSVGVLIPDAKKMNNGQPNEENTLTVTWGNETINGTQYEHGKVDMALELPLTPAQQTEFDKLIPLVNAIIAESVDPTIPFSTIVKVHHYHTCNHEPPVQSCTGVTNF